LDVVHELAKRLAKRRSDPFFLMEVCGTHTVAIARSGLRSLLPNNVRLLSGPGCPVCVTANVDIDYLIALTRLPGLTIASFGDMLRVPGSSSSLAQRRAEGASVQLIYSPLDALRLAQERPEEQIVLIGVGFETTAPLIAATIERAAALGLKNLSVATSHKRVPPALAALVDDPELTLDALILPGHVSTIIGCAPYEFLAHEHHIPGVVAGFEPLDLLQAIALLLERLLEGRASIENAYRRAVADGGNPAAQEAIERVFATRDAEWRGLGPLEGSGLIVRDAFATFDAKRRFEVEVESTVEPRGCRCGDVLRGRISPKGCPLFERACTPAHPLGPCMVSSEGSCAAYSRYGVEDPWIG
jgi:hydrogenase expression/formation protein HypD